MIQYNEHTNTFTRVDKPELPVPQGIWYLPNNAEIIAVGRSYFVKSLTGKITKGFYTRAYQGVIHLTKDEGNLELVSYAFDYMLQEGLIGYNVTPPKPVIPEPDFTDDFPEGAADL